jgi:hypothetical protein
MTRGGRGGGGRGGGGGGGGRGKKNVTSTTTTNVASKAEIATTQATIAKVRKFCCFLRNAQESLKNCHLKDQNSSVSLKIAQFDVDLRAHPRALDVATRLIATALRDNGGVEEVPAVKKKGKKRKKKNI